MTFEEIKQYIIVNRKPLLIGAIAALAIRAMIR